MKAQERHHLKQNEFAQTAARVAGTIREQRDRVAIGLLVLAIVAAVGGGWWYLRKRANDQASGELAIGMAISRQPITPPSSLPTSTQATNTFPNETARHEAALKQFEKTANEHSSSKAGIAARYHAGVELMALGRWPEAEKTFQTVIDQGGSSIYVPSARLGLAETLSVQGKHDDAIKRLTDLAADRDGVLPIDGVLMQLARVSAKAGKTQEARAAYKRVVDEFPESLYVTEARQQLTTLGAG